jgi:hypothetical protein
VNLNGANVHAGNQGGALHGQGLVPRNTTNFTPGVVFSPKLKSLFDKTKREWATAARGNSPLEPNDDAIVCAPRTATPSPDCVDVAKGCVMDVQVDVPLSDSNSELRSDYSNMMVAGGEMPLSTTEMNKTASPMTVLGSPVRTPCPTTPTPPSSPGVQCVEVTTPMEPRWASQQAVCETPDRKRTPTIDEIVAYGGIQEVSKLGERSNSRIQAQPNADRTQLERAMEVAQCREPSGKKVLVLLRS